MAMVFETNEHDIYLYTTSIWQKKYSPNDKGTVFILWTQRDFFWTKTQTLTIYDIVLVLVKMFGKTNESIYLRKLLYSISEAQPEPVIFLPNKSSIIIAISRN